MFLARLSYPFLKKMIFNRSMGVNPLRLVHASQSISLIKPIILEAPLVLEAEVSEVDNCGHSPRFGIVTRFFVEGEAVAEALSGFVVRGKRNPGHNRSDKGPEQPLRELSIATDKNLSRRYARVSGDSNPIHTNSLVARMAGFKSPILQGLCTMSLVYSSLQEHFNVAPAVADHIECSFSSVVYPGEVLRLRIFKGGTGGHPFSLVNHEGREVLKNGIYVF